MFFPSVGEGEPLVTTPMASPASLQQRYASRAMPRSIISMPTSVRRNAAVFDFAVAVQPRLPHINLVADLVPVQRHLGFQAQRIPCAQSAWDNPEFAACFHHLIPNCFA